MKKNLLFAAALFMSVAASAQTVVWSCTSTSADGKAADAVNNEATVTGSETVKAEAITWGAGIMEPTTCQRTHKNAAGESFNYFEDKTICVTKWVPTVASDAAIKNLEDAASSQYIDFKISETDQTKYLNIKKISFNAARYGTDAVRINVKLLIGSDEAGETESGWLFTDDTWEAYSGGEGFWTPGETAEGDLIPGYGPAREDASKANTNDKNEDGYSNIVIPVTTDMIPADAYEVTLRICVYGIGNNKALGLNNVTFSSEAATGISNITATENVDAPAYNIAGQRVNANAKGLIIKNGKKFINK